VCVTVRGTIDQLIAEPAVADLGYPADQRLVATVVLGLRLLADSIDDLEARLAQTTRPLEVVNASTATPDARHHRRNSRHHRASRETGENHQESREGEVTTLHLSAARRKRIAPLVNPGPMPRSGSNSHVYEGSLGTRVVRVRDCLARRLLN
jgi:hypothetical protein